MCIRCKGYLHAKARSAGNTKFQVDLASVKRAGRAANPGAEVEANGVENEAMVVIVVVAAFAAKTTFLQ